MDYSEILASVIAVIGVLMGIVLRYIFDNKKAKKKYNSEYNVDIRNEHKKVYAELIKAVTPLTSLNITPR